MRAMREHDLQQPGCAVGAVIAGQHVFGHR
jgi:hypothetical protein